LVDPRNRESGKQVMNLMGEFMIVGKVEPEVSVPPVE